MSITQYFVYACVYNIHMLVRTKCQAHDFSRAVSSSNHLRAVTLNKGKIVPAVTII